MIIPQGELVNPDTRKFALSNVEIVFNQRFPFSTVFNDYENLLDNLPNLSAQLDFGMSTRAFWIPIWFTSAYTIPINLSKN